MGRNLVETLIGAVVLTVAAVFLVFAYGAVGFGAGNGYTLVGKFDRVDGLNQGSDVRMSGIKIGTVTRQEIDPETYLAVVTFSIRPDIRVPRDSSAQITSDGLLGDRYVSLQPGGADEMLEPGQEITHTQGSVDLISLVGRFIFSQTGNQSPGADGASDGFK
jgi:phospholipid/cholesterol/gamma-HCH transport system substrate-binding protein